MQYAEFYGKMQFMDITFDSVPLDDSEAIEQLLRHTFVHEESRLLHVLKVAEKVAESSQALVRNGIELSCDSAYRAALLHDIGYAEPLRDSGYHPIDGARYLRRRQEPLLAELIECHSNAPEFALLSNLGRITVSLHPIADLITYWDVRVKQGGQVVSYEERLADIRKRHGAESLVWRAHELANPRIEILNARVEKMLAGT